MIRRTPHWAAASFFPKRLRRKRTTKRTRIRLKVGALPKARTQSPSRVTSSSATSRFMRCLPAKKKTPKTYISACLSKTASQAKRSEKIRKSKRAKTQRCLRRPNIRDIHSRNGIDRTRTLPQRRKLPRSIQKTNIGSQKITWAKRKTRASNLNPRSL